jgi:carbamoyltransferase
VLSEYKTHTGRGVVVNTSLNIHQDPIVRTPEEAVRTFVEGRLDYLVAGDFVAEGAHVGVERHPRQVSKYFS